MLYSIYSLIKYNNVSIKYNDVFSVTMHKPLVLTDYFEGQNQVETHFFKTVGHFNHLRIVLSIYQSLPFALLSLLDW